MSRLLHRNVSFPDGQLDRKELAREIKKMSCTATSTSHPQDPGSPKTCTNRPQQKMSEETPNGYVLFLAGCVELGLEGTMSSRVPFAAASAHVALVLPRIGSGGIGSDLHLDKLS